MFNKFIDVAQIMRELKKESNSTNSRDGVSDKSDIYHEEWNQRKQEILNYRNQIEFHKDIGMKIPQFLSFNKYTRKVLRLFSKVINKAAFIITRDQNIVNNHVMLSIDKLRESIEILLLKVDTNNRSLNTKLKEYEEYNNTLKNELEYIKKKISRINQKANRLSSPPTKTVKVIERKDNDISTQSNLLYRDFEDKFRGSESVIKSRLKSYIEYLNQDEFSHLNKCLDIGSGRGEWLELLEENGFDCIGVDINSEFVDLCKAKGLRVFYDDIFNYIKGLDDNSFDVISAFHVVEHIEFDRLNYLLSEINRVLKPGGILILETPNPENITVGACNFYLDPTHIRPVHPKRIEFQLEYFGFYNIQYLFWQKDRIEKREQIRNSIANSDLDNNIKQLLFTSNCWFNNQEDIGIIGRKAQ